MQTYIVGGFVRDLLLSAEGSAARPNDRDWVVVGETPESMIRRGFKPVGEDFPVFLHPKTHEEYALARTERKTAPGYHGFVFHAAADVTLEEDLKRRDLTVNAIAMTESGDFIDPYGGMRDLKAHVLRHVSDAFAEDPVRILRLARFAARFPSFSVAPETMALMRQMVESGEADALVPERVLAELAKGLACPVPSRMLDVLEACGFWMRRYADIPLGSATRQALHRCILSGLPVSMRFAALTTELADERHVKAFLTSIRASADTVSFAETLKRIEVPLKRLASAEDAVEVFLKADALRRRDRMMLLLEYGSRVFPETLGSQAKQLQRRIEAALEAWCSVNAGAVAKTQTNPRDIASAVLNARCDAVRAAWQASEGS
ncbi:CCA-adding protein [Sutterella massiliensis]|uniref:CCA-adding protein n=1 Tax=Sutterella massiliensis TaxID=1816689 RepID=A0ABS2DNS1_9BURK|nr:CCA-adding protein [Sutterella massiliensis]MBM6703031.1 CCA-adding protein [Sutterella massiliensis]